MDDAAAVWFNYFYDPDCRCIECRIRRWRREWMMEKVRWAALRQRQGADDDKQ